MKIGQAHGETNTGRKRRHNEDSFVCAPPLFAVADGMGGAQAGEVASSLAAESLLEGGRPEPVGEVGVAALINAANRRVHERAVSDASASGMGTTMTVALFTADGTITIGHVGDSRAYVLRRGGLAQLTDDHSLVAELVRRGELSPAEAEVHPQRSVITRALGTDPDVDVDAFSLPSQPGDIFLLCSDGLTTMVDARTMAEVVEQNRDDLKAAARALIGAANRNGGEDNITAVLFEVAEGDDLEPTVERIEVRDDADTLHPGEVPAIEVPPIGDPTEDTVILSVEELRSHFAVADSPPTAVPILRMAISSILIAALAIVIFFLVTKGLTR